MPFMYYDQSSGIGGGGGVVYSCSPYSSNAGADYAGVFESGCDPAAVRASLQSRTPPSPYRIRAAPPLDYAVNESSSESSSAAVPFDGHDRGYSDGASYGGVDDDNSDCLFAMEGPEAVAGTSTNDASSAGMYSNAGRVADNVGRGGTGGGCATLFKPLASVATTAGATAANMGTACAGAGPAGGSDDGGGRRSVTSTAEAAGPSAALRSDMVSVKGGGGQGRPRATPRVMAHGRRCTAAGMYRLRLSTSC